MIVDFGAAHGLRPIALRYFNAAGANPDNEIGEQHDPEANLISFVLVAASGRRPHITIFGTDYDAIDGTFVRDYTHVTDLADAHVEALQALEAGAPSDDFNLGSGRAFSVRELVAAVERVTDLQVPVAFGPRRSGDPATLISNAAKTHVTLDWEQQIARLEDIVRTAWGWHQRAQRAAGRSMTAG